MIRLTPVKAIVLLVLFGWIAYANSFTKEFLLDDNIWISTNEHLHDWYRNLLTFGHLRPLVALSLTANYHLGGFYVVGYHVVNVAVHILAGVTLFGIIRRTLLLPRWIGRFDRSATSLAFAIALIWLVHPMNTHAVTYVIQRCESMMGLAYLATLYAVLRGSQSARSTPWYVAAIASAWLGIFCKEVMATAPLVILIYDRVFLADSWRELLRKRWGLYLGLWSIIGFFLYRHYAPLATPGGSESAGFNLPGLSPTDYFLTQAWVILHYLRLAVWPSDLCFDYRDWIVTRSIADFLPAGLPLAVLFLASCYGVWRRSAFGFLGLWFFLILAPTSSFVALLDIVCEYRMYLPLIAVVTAGVMGTYVLVERFASQAPRGPLVAALVLAGITLPLIARTHVRNEDYRTPLAMWQDTIEKRPANYKVYQHVGAAYESDAKWEEAIEAQLTCLQHQPANFFALTNMGLLRYRGGQRQEGIDYLKKALRIYNTHPDTTTYLATYFLLEGDLKKAEPVMELAVRVGPNKALPRYHRAALYRDLGRMDDARREYAEALKEFPDWPERMQKFVHARLRGRFGHSEGVAREAVFFARIAVEATEEKVPKYLTSLADAYALKGDAAKALEFAQKALAITSDHDIELRRQLESRIHRFASAH